MRNIARKSKKVGSNIRFLGSQTSHFAIKYITIFVPFSIFGWIFEVFLKRFITQGYWINPGYLNGPFLPIYGIGACILYLLSEVKMKLWVRVVVSIVLMTTIEYFIGLYFLLVHNRMLWDYSRMPINLQGLICPEFSLIWGAMALLFYFYIYTHLKGVIEYIIKHPRMSLFVGIIFGMFLYSLLSTLIYAYTGVRF